jgi:hypothetical protein
MTLQSTSKSLLAFSVLQRSYWRRSLSRNPLFNALAVDHDLVKFFQCCRNG